MIKKIPVRSSFDLVRVRELCQMMAGKGNANRLGDEILEEVESKSEPGYLTGKTYKRLAKWADPRNLQPNVQPFAEAICYELFGMKISRID